MIAFFHVGLINANGVDPKQLVHARLASSREIFMKVLPDRETLPVDEDDMVGRWRSPGIGQAAIGHS